MYLLLKALHLSLALTSVTLLLWRLHRSRMGQPRRTPRWVHAIDSLLLISAGLLIWQTIPWPWPHWLQLKVAVLLVYIVTAGLALRRPPGWRQNALGLVSLLCIVVVVLLASLKPFSY